MTTQFAQQDNNLSPNLNNTQQTQHLQQKKETQTKRARKTILVGLGIAVVFTIMWSSTNIYNKNKVVEAPIKDVSEKSTTPAQTTVFDTESKLQEANQKLQQNKGIRNILYTIPESYNTLERRAGYRYTKQGSPQIQANYYESLQTYRDTSPFYELIQATPENVTTSEILDNKVESFTFLDGVAGSQHVEVLAIYYNLGVYEFSVSDTAKNEMRVKQIKKDLLNSLLFCKTPETIKQNEYISKKNGFVALNEYDCLFESYPSTETTPIGFINVYVGLDLNMSSAEVKQLESRTVSGSRTDEPTYEVYMGNQTYQLGMGQYLRTETCEFNNPDCLFRKSLIPESASLSGIYNYLYITESIDPESNIYLITFSGSIEGMMYEGAIQKTSGNEIFEEQEVEMWKQTLLDNIVISTN